eukprot:10501441-Prorocentrum_lima.AAC.1
MAQCVVWCGDDACGVSMVWCGVAMAWCGVASGVSMAWCGVALSAALHTITARSKHVPPLIDHLRHNGW